MESNSKAINIVVDLLKKHGIRYIVISPGGTNIPFVNKVQKDPFFKCYSVVDERSAIYFAIGIYLNTGELVATSCTSAQATRNYLPGLTEAFYKNVPILAITMSKHPRFTGQEYMQAPNQTSLPKDSVKNSYMLPYICDNNDSAHAIRLVNEAILDLTSNGKGPVQLCIPWLDFENNNEPDIRCIKKYMLRDPYDFTLDGKKIMMVIGEHRPFSENENRAINEFAEKFDCVIYKNHISNYHGDYEIDANLIFSTMKIADFENDYAPDILISIGGQTGDYPFYKMIAGCRQDLIEHWRISEKGDLVDTYDRLTKVFCGAFDEVLNRFDSNSNNGHKYFDKWDRCIKSKKINIDVPFSNVYAAQCIHDKLPLNSIVQFSILNSLRTWELFPIDKTIKCYSNVGAFGIDGGLSTLLGQSVTTDELCFMIIGDLAFFYDMNSIGIRHIKNNVRILIVNNNGGIEFKLYGGNYKEIDEFIALLKLELKFVWLIK